MKNPKNNWTFLDDLSEQINNHINRKGSCAIGGSSSIAGSGFAVGFDVGKEVFRSLNSVGGFDKEFELELLKRGVKTSYVEGLKIYDEKVANNQVFKKQRTRWIASQYAFLRKYLIMGILAFFRRDYSFFNSSILRNMQLPRLLNLGLFTSIFLIVLLFSGHTKIPVSMWAITYGLFVVAILLAIPKRFYNYQLLQSMLILPRIFMQMFLILFKLKGANKNFIHTPHGTIVKNDPS
jgi:cellulose synthase/poly-beta-1,6-N-acetylglucosamine synthase-like glycosyltransferase